MFVTQTRIRFCIFALRILTIQHEPCYTLKSFALAQAI